MPCLGRDHTGVMGGKGNMLRIILHRPIGTIDDQGIAVGEHPREIFNIGEIARAKLHGG